MLVFGVAWFGGAEVAGHRRGEQRQAEAELQQFITMRRRAGRMSDVVIDSEPIYATTEPVDPNDHLSPDQPTGPIPYIPAEATT